MFTSLPRNIRRILQPEDLSPEAPPGDQPQGQTEDDEKESDPPRASIDPFEGLEAEPEPRAPLLESANDPTIEDVEFLSGIGREAQVWTTYVKETKEFDDDMVDGWNRFVLESAKQLQPDKADQTVMILREISRALQANGAQNALVGQSDPGSDVEFHPKRNAIWVNCLWFLSLSLSVAVSLAAMLAKQWCYYYLSARSGDTITQAEDRQNRFSGLAKWRMRGILEHLQMLMHISLALFSVGLILYLWDINVAVASTVSAVSISALCFYLSTTFLPVWDIFCPFKTPQSVYTRIILDHIAHGFTSLRAEKLRAQGLHYKIKIQALWHTFLLPFQTIKVWIASQVLHRTRLAQESVQELPAATHPHATIDMTNTGQLLSHSDLPFSTRSDEETQPFVKDALQWLIFNSQKSSSIDTAIGALAIGEVPFENDDLKHQVNLHLVKRFSDCFVPGRCGVKPQLSHHQNAPDYVNWMTYFAAKDSLELTKRVVEFSKSFGTELVTRLGVAFARQVFSLADQRSLSVDVGRKVALWLSAFVICYDEGQLYLNEEVLSRLIDGLTIAGRNVSDKAPERAGILAIPHLINILWKVSHVDNCILRSSIGLNLAVFALTTDIPYSINTRHFKPAADHLAYDYRSPKDRNANFTSFVVFALLGFVHPKSKLGLDIETLDTVTQIIHETRYLTRTNLSIKLPKLAEPYSLRRRLTSMLVESMIQTPDSSPMPRRHLLWTAYKRIGVAHEWTEEPFPSTLHALHCLITSHLRGQAVLYDDAIIAATDLLYGEVQKLKGLDAAIIGPAAFAPAHSDIDVSGENPTHDGTSETSSPERMASTALALVMEKSSNKQCLEIAVRAVLFHTKNKKCDVGLVMKATRWFAKTFNIPGYKEAGVNEDQLLHMCGYVRILISMVFHCTNPGDLADSLHGSDEAISDAKIVEEKLQLLATKASDTHVHAFGVASLAIWKFGCPNKTYSTKTTQGALNEVWGLITKHADCVTQAGLLEHCTGHQVHDDMLRPEAIEALIDTTVMFVAVTNPTPSISQSEVQALLRLLDQFKSEANEPVRPALAAALTFWGLSLDTEHWDFWTVDQRTEYWRTYAQPKERKKDVAALFLLGLSRVLANYEQLKLGHASIKTIALEIDHYMHQHANHPDTLTLPFLTGFDVRRHVREAVWDYLQKTESGGPFTKSTCASRDKLRSALQYDGGEGFWYEEPHPLARRERGRGVSFSSE
ncbi:hypothetical protein FRC10_003289 [Ceratobasidium sp. 414]|nr:hypothetical protein FRC10_003289 [Ceratobasidium sp. 414]